MGEDQGEEEAGAGREADGDGEAELHVPAHDRQLF